MYVGGGDSCFRYLLTKQWVNLRCFFWFFFLRTLTNQDLPLMTAEDTPSYPHPHPPREREREREKKERVLNEKYSPCTNHRMSRNLITQELTAKHNIHFELLRATVALKVRERSLTVL